LTYFIMPDCRPREVLLLLPYIEAWKENAVATVARFEIGHTGFIDPQPYVTQSRPAFVLDGAALVPMPGHGADAAVRRQGGCNAADRPARHVFFVAEAIGVGLASLMRPEDVLLSSYRNPTAHLLRAMFFPMRYRSRYSYATWPASH
jgi:hypothetical protein